MKHCWAAGAFSGQRARGRGKGPSINHRRHVSRGADRPRAASRLGCVSATTKRGMAARSLGSCFRPRALQLPPPRSLLAGTQTPDVTARYSRSHGILAILKEFWDRQKKKTTPVSLLRRGAVTGAGLGAIGPAKRCGFHRFPPEVTPRRTPPDVTRRTRRPCAEARASRPSPSASPTLGQPRRRRSVLAAARGLHKSVGQRTRTTRKSSAETNEKGATRWTSLRTGRQAPRWQRRVRRLRFRLGARRGLRFGLRLGRR